jgi:hypothetical protein
VSTGKSPSLDRDGRYVDFPNSSIREKAMSLLNQAAKLLIRNARAAPFRNCDPFVFANREQAVDRPVFDRDKTSIILNFSQI